MRMHRTETILRHSREDLEGHHIGCDVVQPFVAMKLIFAVAVSAAA